MMAPKLAEWMQAMGVEFTSDEFLFFQKVISDTLKRREELNIRRGDFLDLMKDTHSRMKFFINLMSF